jgi:hypothetical protein
MKHTVALGSVLFSLLSWSCGGGSTPTAPTPTPVATSITLSDAILYVYPDMDRGFFGGSSGAIDYEALVRGRALQNPPSQTEPASAAVTDAVRLAWNRTLDFLR